VAVAVVVAMDVKIFNSAQFPLNIFMI
jgi:hypothetical protein